MNGCFNLCLRIPVNHRMRQKVLVWIQVLWLEAYAIRMFYSLRKRIQNVTFTHFKSTYDHVNTIDGSFPRAWDGGVLCMRGILRLKLHWHQRPFIMWLQWPPPSPLHLCILPPAYSEGRNTPRSWNTPSLWIILVIWVPFLIPTFAVQPEQHLSCEFFPDSHSS